VNLLNFINEMERILGKKAMHILMPMQEGDVKITFADTAKIEEEIEYRAANSCPGRS
jgi:UDP-glucuronate 4-epimerase